MKASNSPYSLPNPRFYPRPPGEQPSPFKANFPLGLLIQFLSLGLCSVPNSLLFIMVKNNHQKVDERLFLTTTIIPFRAKLFERMFGGSLLLSHLL